MDASRERPQLRLFRFAAILHLVILVAVFHFAIEIALQAIEIVVDAFDIVVQLAVHFKQIVDGFGRDAQSVDQLAHEIPLRRGVRGVHAVRQAFEILDFAGEIGHRLLL